MQLEQLGSNIFIDGKQTALEFFRLKNKLTQTDTVEVKI
jgi:hypothetical protein